jgi:YVTN family beta-propeller protein
VTPIDTATNTPGPQIPAGNQPRFIAITPDGKTAYVTNSGTDTVTPIQTATNTAEPAITVGYEPYALAITPDSKTAYVADVTSPGTVTPIDTATNAAGPAITVGNAPLPSQSHPPPSLKCPSSPAAPLPRRRSGFRSRSQ